MNLDNKTVCLNLKTLIVWCGAVLIAFCGILNYFYELGKDNANSSFYKESIALYNENKNIKNDIKKLNDSITTLTTKNKGLTKEIDKISKELPNDTKENIIGFYNTLKTPIEVIITRVSDNKPYQLSFTIKPEDFSYHKFEYANYQYNMKSDGTIIKENELIRFHAAGRIRLIAIK